MTEIDRRRFLKRLRSLYCIDHAQLPELTAEQWIAFRTDPPRYFRNTDGPQSAAIWREIERRQVS